MRRSVELIREDGRAPYLARFTTAKKFHYLEVGGLQKE